MRMEVPGRARTVRSHEIGCISKSCCLIRWRPSVTRSQVICNLPIRPSTLMFQVPSAILRIAIVSHRIASHHASQTAPNNTAQQSTAQVQQAQAQAQAQQSTEQQPRHTSHHLGDDVFLFPEWHCTCDFPSHWPPSRLRFGILQHWFKARQRPQRIRRRRRFPALESVGMVFGTCGTSPVCRWTTLLQPCLVNMARRFTSVWDHSLFFSLSSSTPLLRSLGVGGALVQMYMYSMYVCT
jgi:hypothetical protein